MSRISRRSRFSATLVLLVFCAGCVGPNKLKRGLDRHLNESYQKRPLVSQLLFPVNLIANHLAVFGDLLILNPTYWWRDVFRGEGTAYDYEKGEVREGAPEAEDGDQETAQTTEKDTNEVGTTGAQSWTTTGRR